MAHFPSMFQICLLFGLWCHQGCAFERDELGYLIQDLMSENSPEAHTMVCVRVYSKLYKKKLLIALKIVHVYVCLFSV
jgi:hypothetical protein